MGFSFMDFLEMAAPIGIAAIPGVGIPASIALSAALKGGTRAAKGGSLAEILRDTAIGGAGGAAGAGTAGMISKTAGKAGQAAAGKGIEAATKTIGTAGDVGFGKAMEQSMKQLARAGTKQKLAQGVSSAFSGALGDDPERTASLLNMAKKGGRVAGSLDQAYQFLNQPPRFSQQHAALSRHPGMNPSYQFGGGYSTPTVGFLGGF